LIVYFDTSAIVPIVIDEPSSPAAARLWDEADRVVSSRLVYVEGQAALAMACRLRRIDERQLRTVVEDFELLTRQIDIVEVTKNLVLQAGALAEQFDVRGCEAVHLASARLIDDPDVVFAAADAHLLAAARGLGISVAHFTSRS
jgi:uncharacterized protein